MLRRVALVVALSLAGCQVYSDALLVAADPTGADAGGDAKVTDARDAGGDTSEPVVDASDASAADVVTDDAAPNDGSTCALRRPPPRPAADGAPPDGGAPGDVLFVLKDIVLDQGSDAWRAIGLDLDGLCSNPPNPQVECVPPGGGAPEIDGDDGIDNAFGHIVVPLLKISDPTLQDDARQGQASGQGNPVVHLSGWNGADDDVSVSVWMAQSIDAVPAGEAGPGQPKWDGTDAFELDDGAFVNGDLAKPIVANDNAYIAGRTLVFRLPDRSPLYFSSSKATFGLKLTDATLMGTISKDGSMLSSVIMAGRWSRVDFEENLDQAGFCAGTLERTLASNLMNNSADLRATPGTGGPGATCDALSVGVAFTGYRGVLGAVKPVADHPSPCAPTDASTPD